MKQRCLALLLAEGQGLALWIEAIGLELIAQGGLQQRLFARVQGLPVLLVKAGD